MSLQKYFKNQVLEQLLDKVDKDFIYKVCKYEVNITDVDENNIVNFCKMVFYRLSIQDMRISRNLTTRKNYINPLAYGIYYRCFVCDDFDLMESERVETVVICEVDMCDLCFNMMHKKKQSVYREQSAILADEAKDDIMRRVATVGSWLMNGQKHKEPFLANYVKIPMCIVDEIDLLEDICILAHHMLLSRNLADRYVAVVNFCKLRGSRIGFTTTLGYIIADLFGSQLKKSREKRNLKNEVYSKIKKEQLDNVEYKFQAEEIYDNVFAEARSYINMYDKLKETAIYKKLYKFMLYILSINLLKGVNITFDSLGFEKYQAMALKATHKPGADMVHCMLDTICFVCERGLQFFKTGDFDTIFHSGASYEKWVTRVFELKKERKLLSVGNQNSRFKFLSNLKDLIEQGKSIIKFSAKLDKSEKIYLQKTLFELEMISADELSKKAAQQPRKDPFAVLIHGPSSICKSTLKQILFYHYAKVFGLPHSPDYMYTRCPTDEYWSGFMTHMWCIVMDDIAFLKPNGEVDPTLKELLQVKNSVPYTPPQAALEDKGKTPVRAELVIGTTNTKHLNLNAYFSCPFAIARRLSWIISAEIKPEYSKNEIMADSQKIPITPDGEYLNIWNFKISVPIPDEPKRHMPKDNMGTKYKIIHEFTDINDMLCWYIEVAKEHESNQGKAAAVEDVISKIQVCDKCYKISKLCICELFEHQSDELLVPFEDDDDSLDQREEDALQNASFPFRIKMFILMKILNGTQNPSLTAFFAYNIKYWIFALLILLYFIHYGIILFLAFIFIFCDLCNVYGWVISSFYFRWHYGTYWKYRLAFSVVGNEKEAYRLLFISAGKNIKRKFFTQKNLWYIKVFLSQAAVVATLCMLFKKYVDKSKNKKTYEEQLSEGVVPEPKEIEKKKFYYNDPYVHTNVELTDQSLTAQGDILENRVHKNLAKFFFRFESVPGKRFTTSALNIKGQIWAVNAHVLKEDKGLIDVIFDPEDQNISRNMNAISFSKMDVTRVVDKDIAFIRLKDIPPGRDLSKYFPKEPIDGRYIGFYYMISKTGERYRTALADIHKKADPMGYLNSYRARTNVITRYGDCGSPCVIVTDKFRSIIGIHSSGADDGGVCIASICQKDLSIINTVFEHQVSCSSEPISAMGCKRELIPVNMKSEVRFIEKGTAEVIGSFAGYRPKHKSKVKKTFIRDYVVNDGNYVDNFGAPDMSWRPYNLALTDMVHIHRNINKTILQECEDSFVHELLNDLGDKIKMLQIYTQDVALNGVEGVAFVDRINVNTSAGNPYKKSKKNFINLDENNKISHVDKCIQERINQILEKYSRGRRYHPQFCAHLKDESVSEKKIKLGKTRVFMGAEFAWSIVVRMYFLSSIRLIQNNPYIFEAMPGIVAQSGEWDELYNYLIHFGEDKIIAGDYAKFDKRMAASFILSAFNILIRLCEKAGWKSEDLIVLRCISYDTAFYSADFNGTLFHLEGNPSGHPLTVIINCLVNSLYIRYAYRLSTNKDLKDFKKYVHLATYGDDNIMGVNSELNNFNHTTISTCLLTIGVEYTMADKEADSKPFINISESTFLKRSFRYDVDFQKYVAPLDESSFHKMLTNYVDNGTLAPQAHSLCVIETALREYAFYGKKVFEERKKYFFEMVNALDLNLWVRDSTFPNFEDLVKEFHERQ